MTARVSGDTRAVLTSVLETGDGYLLAGTRSNGLYRIGAHGEVDRIGAPRRDRNRLGETLPLEII